MERQHGLNNQQRSLFRGYPNMNGEFPVHMYKIILTSLVVLLCGCNKKVETGLTNPVVVSSIDSICALCEPRLNSPFEHIWLDERYLTDERNPKFKQWIYGDSIAKYCNSDELTELATKHNSLAVRYVAFKMLLKKDSHRAIKVLIDDIDSNETMYCADCLEYCDKLNNKQNLNNQEDYNEDCWDDIYLKDLADYSG